MLTTLPAQPSSKAQVAEHERQAKEKNRTRTLGLEHAARFTARSQRPPPKISTLNKTGKEKHYE
jgi:hypothetical protein